MNTQHALELNIIYTDESVIKNVYWQWRNGRCVRNGISPTPERAVSDAHEAYLNWVLHL